MSRRYDFDLWPLMTLKTISAIFTYMLNSCAKFNWNASTKILGATLDANLTLAPHIKALSSSCFHHIRSFRQIRSSLDNSTAVSVASALISSRLDQLNWSRRMAFHLSTHLAFNESSVQWPGLFCLSNIAHLQMNFLNNSIGSLSNGVYGLNLPPWPSKPCTPVVRHISLTSCIIMNLWGPCAHPVLISFLFPVTTYLLDLVLFDFPLPESVIHYPSASVSLTRFLLLDVI